MIEKVSHKNNFANEIAEFALANELLKDPTTRRDYFEQMDASDFIDFTQQIASMVRTGNSNEHQHFDGNIVALMGHEVPDQRDKEQLLRETWDTAKKFLLDRDLSDEDALEYAGLTVAGGVLYAHPYEDGNGRTSRVESYLISVGSADPDEFNQLLESNSSRWNVTPLDMTPGPSRDRHFDGRQPGVLEDEMEFVDDAEDALDGKIVASRYTDYIVRSFLEKYQSDEQVQSYLDLCLQSREGEVTALPVEKFLELLANDQEHGMLYAKELLDFKREAEAVYVRNFLRAMASDELREPSKLGRMLRPPVVENELVRRRYEVAAREFGKRALGTKVLHRDEVAITHRAVSGFHHDKFSNQ